MSQTTHTFRLRDLMSSGLERIGQVGASVFGRLDRAQDKVARGVDGLTGKIGGLVAAAGLAQIGRNVLETTANFEKMEAVLTNTLGSRSAAQGSMRMIQDFAARTPFQVDQLTDSFVKLANRGFVPTEMEMTRLGDIASSTGKDFDQLVEALLDAQTGEFERLKEFGIRASSQGDQVAFTFKGVTTTVEKTDAAIKDYILSLGDLQGVSGSMAAISGTLAGQLSNVQDKTTNLWRVMGENLRPVIGELVGMFGGLIDRATSMVNWLGQNTAVAKGLAVGLGVVAGALGIVKIATIAWNAVLAANPIGLVIIGIGALVGALVYAWNKFEGFRGAIYGLWEGMKEVFTLMKENFINTFGGLGQLIAGVFTFDAARIKEGIAMMGKGLAGQVNIGAQARRIGAAYNRGDQAGRNAFAAANLPGVTGGSMYDAPLMQFSGGGGGAAGAAPGGGATAAGGGGMDAGIAGVAAGARSMRNFTIHIERVTGIESVNTTTIQGAIQDADDALARAIMRIFRDVQTAAG